MSKALTKQRRNLWLRNPHCFYCGVKTIFERPKGVPIPANLATIDHLRPRHHPERRVPAQNGEVRRVLSCWKCNNERDRRELAEKPREWFYANGGAKPLSYKSTEELQWIVLKLEYDLVYPGKSKRARSRRRRIHASLDAVRAEIASRPEII